MRLEVVDVVEAVSQLVNKGYDREYRIKDGYLFDLALNSPLDPRDIHVDTALRFEPLLFLLNRPRLGSTSEGTLHRGSRRTLTAVSVRSPHAVQSPAVRWFRDNGLLPVVRGTEYLLELVWDHGTEGRSERLAAPLPLVVRW
jgi:hypothetical protein